MIVIVIFSAVCQTFKSNKCAQQLKLCILPVSSDSTKADFFFEAVQAAIVTLIHAPSETYNCNRWQTSMKGPR